MFFQNNINNFDADGVGVANGAFFGMPFSPSEAALVLLSVPWDVTSSYGAGSAAGPEAIVAASTQLDFFDPWAPEAWRRGIATLPIDPDIRVQSESLRPRAERIIAALEAGDTPDHKVVESINTASVRLTAEVQKTAADHLAAGRIVGLVGGDHSTPLGLINAIAASTGSLGVLHLDAHCDLRPAYEGFTHSHASIMYNALTLNPRIERLVQVGVRDFSEAEYKFALADPRIVQFTGAELAENRFAGTTWAVQCERIVEALPQKVYVSFDIDFLSPELCPGTGTPVPGGQSFLEAIFLIRSVVDSGRKIVGFDLCEVSPQNPIDAVVGARILFALCGQTLKKNH